MKTKKNIFVWCNDFENYTGEGILARNFINKIFSNSSHKINIRSNNAEYLYYNRKIKTIRYSKYKNNFINKYIKLFWGILLIRFHNFYGYKTFYINYLPLWNFLIFLMLPKNTYLGPITGGTHIEKEVGINYIVRKYFFPIFYKFSSNIINRKYDFLMFSTEMLRKYLNKENIKKSLFNLTIICFDNNKKRKIKDIDFLIYYRKHSNKSNYFLKKITQKLSIQKKVFVAGDKISGKNITNLGNINRDKLFKYLARTKFSVSSSENFYSLFALDCIANDVLLFINKKNYLNKNYFPRYSLKTINFNHFNQSFKQLIRVKKKNKAEEKIELIKKKKELIKKIISQIKIN